MALSSNSIFTRILLTFRFLTFTLKVTGEKYERHTMWHERFCGFYIRHPQKQKTKKCPRRKKIPQKFNMSLPGELSKVSPDYEIHCPTHNCHFWYPVWIFAIFWILPALWRFFANCAKFAIFANFAIFAKIATLFRQNRHSPRGQFWHLIWIAMTRAFFRISPHFPHCMKFWTQGWI